MGALGWSLPAGCSTLPGEEEPYVFPEQEAVTSLLEGAGIDADSETGEKVDAIVQQLCSDLAELREALSCAVRMKAVVRFEATELSTTTGFGVNLPSSEAAAVATSFVQLMRSAYDD